MLTAFLQPLSWQSAEGRFACFPGKFKAPDPQIPLAILHIAASLKEEGFSVRILDMRLEDYRHFEVGNPFFVGISCMSGLQIKYARVRALC